MADGNQQDQSNPYGAAIQVPNFPPVRDVTERFLGMANTEEGSPLDKALQQHHAERLAQTQMYRDVLASALGQLHKGTKWDSSLNNGLGGERPFTPDEENTLRAQIEYGRNQYGKLIGVNPQTKEAVNKAHQIIDFIMGHKKQMDAQAAQGSSVAAPSAPAQAPTPQYPTNVSDSGVSYIPPDQRPGSMPPPPAPNYPTTVSDAGVSFKAPPTPTGGGATSMVPPEAAYTDANGLYHPALKHRSAAEVENAAAPALTPQAAAATPAARKPFTMDPLELSLMAPVEAHKLGVSQKMEDTQRAYAQQHLMWRREADQLFPKDSKEWKWYSATGTLPRQFGLQLKPIEFVGPDGAIHRVNANYDPGTGTAEFNGQIIQNPLVVDKPQGIRYLKYDQTGKPHLVGGFMVGTQYFDQNMQPLPNNTEFYNRGTMGRDTLRQTITYGPDGPIINTLETISNPTSQRAIWGDEPNAGAPIPTASPKTPQVATPPPAAQGLGMTPTAGPAPKKQQVTGSGMPVPQSRGGGKKDQAVDALGRPLGISSGMWNQQTNRAIPIREAATQLFGDPTQPGMKSMKDFSYLADDPAARQRLAKAFLITFNGLRDREEKTGGIWNLIQMYGGMPKAIAEARSGVREDVMNELKGHPDELEAYDTTMNAYGSITGLRTLNKGIASETSVQKIENEMPLVGINSVTSDQYNDQLSRLAENVYSGSRTMFKSIMPQDEKDYIKAQVMGLKKNKSGANRQVATPPPTAAPTNANDYLASKGIKVNQ